MNSRNNVTTYHQLKITPENREKEEKSEWEKVSFDFFFYFGAIYLRGRMLTGRKCMRLPPNCEIVPDIMYVQM